MYKILNKFEHSKPYTIGVEEEYMLSDPSSGDLVNKADDIFAVLPQKLKNRYSYELILSEIEVNTSVCENVKMAIDELIYLRNNTRILGEEIGFRLAAAGTHPSAMCKDQKFVKNEAYNWVSNQLNYYARRNITFSTHVHIAINNKDCAIHVANSLRRWIAPLLALSTNSPFFENQLTGMRSSRTFQFSTFPRTNIPEKFDDYNDYVNLVQNFILTKSINKPRQIWWKIRPHLDYGTIEFRMFDVQRKLSNTEMLIAISQALVHRSVIDYQNGDLIEDFNMEYLNDGLWKATRFSFNTDMIDPVTESLSTLKEQINFLISYIYNSLDYFNNLHIINYVENILKSGTEGDRQLSVYNKYGMDRLKMYLMDDIDYK